MATNEALYMRFHVFGTSVSIPWLWETDILSSQWSLMIILSPFRYILPTFPSRPWACWVDSLGVQKGMLCRSLSLFCVPCTLSMHHLFSRFTGICPELSEYLVTWKCRFYLFSSRRLLCFVWVTPPFYSLANISRQETRKCRAHLAKVYLSLYFSLIKIKIVHILNKLISFSRRVERKASAIGT